MIGKDNMALSPCWWKRWWIGSNFTVAVIELRIGSNWEKPRGVGVCRHLVKDRDITGAKWRLTSAEAVLHLRALRSSNDFDEYWDFHEACEYKRNHQALYQHFSIRPH